MNAVQDIAIQRLQIRARESDTRTLLSDLETASWSVPQDGWYFVRSLSAYGRSSQVRQQLGEALQASFSRAVAGGSSAAPGAEVVCFRSLPELLTFLLRDLLNGSAAYKWFWQRWQPLLAQSRQQAIAELLWEHIDQLPALVHSLAQEHLLTPVWLSLSPQSAEQLLHRLATRRQMAWPTQLAAQTHTDVEEPLATLESRIDGILRDREPLLGAWRQSLGKLPSSDARLQLAALVCGLTHCPLLLRQDARALLAGFQRALDPTPPAPAPPKGANPPQSAPEVRRAQQPHAQSTEFTESGQASQTRTEPRLVGEEGGTLNWRDRPSTDQFAGMASEDTGPRAAARETPPPPPAKSETSPLPATGKPEAVRTIERLSDQPGNPANLPTPRTPPPNPDINAEAQGGHWREQAAPTAGEQPASTEASLIAPATTPPEPFTASDQHVPARQQVPRAGLSSISGAELHTGSGGLFYLINAMASDHCQRLLASGQDHLPPSGWPWLLDIAQRLGGDIDITLVDYIAAQSGWEDAKSLLTQLPLTACDPAFAWLMEQYRERDFWGASLIQVPARVVSTASHIDVFYSLDQVRLSVRLAGLDTNPGWQPWLGRVFQFHYH